MSVLPQMSSSPNDFSRHFWYSDLLTQEQDTKERNVYKLTGIYLRVVCFIVVLVMGGDVFAVRKNRLTYEQWLKCNYNVTRIISICL